MKKHSIGSLLFIGLVLVIMYLPIAVVVVYSFNANTARIPIDFTGWTTAWYGKLFENRSGFGDALLLSVRVALWAVVISCVIGTLGAIGMANRAGGRHSRLDTAMESLMSLPIMIPEIILGLAFMVVFNAMGIRGNDLYITEINTIPGSLAFYLWEAGGMPYSRLIDEMVRCAMEAQKDKDDSNYAYSSDILSNISLGGKAGSKAGLKNA